MGVLVVDPVLGEQAIEDVGVRLDQFGTEDARHPDRLELVIEGAGAVADDDPIADQLSERPDRQRGVDRMAEGDQGSGSQRDAVGDGAHRGEGGEGFVEDDVGILEFLMGLEHQMVSNPQGVETQFLGEPGTDEYPLSVGVHTEVGQEQAEFHCGNPLLLLAGSHMTAVSGSPRDGPVSVYLGASQEGAFHGADDLAAVVGGPADLGQNVLVADGPLPGGVDND